MFSTDSLIEQALERTEGNRVLAEALVKIAAGFLTPINDPLHDFQIKKMLDIKDAVETKDAYGQVWRTVPEVIETRQFVAPAKQCVLAWGTRMVPGQANPTPVAVLAWITRTEEGITPVIGAHFYFAGADNNVRPRWFTRDVVDVHTRDAVEYYLNSLTGATTGAGDRVGVDLD